MELASACARVARTARACGVVARVDCTDKMSNAEEEHELGRLRERVRVLEQELSAVREKDETKRRRKIATMTAEVVDTNPYR